MKGGEHPEQDRDPPPNGITTTLLVRTAKLDQRAMTELMSRIRPRISNMVRAWARGANESFDDYVAECVLAVVRGFDGFNLRQGGSFNGWLSVIVRNKIVDLYRRRGQPTLPLGEPGSDGPVVVVSSPPVTYVEQQPAPAVSAAPAAQNPAAGYWYYCAESSAYYPYVQQCASGWQRVSPTPPGQ